MRASLRPSILTSSSHQHIVSWMKSVILATTMMLAWMSDEGRSCGVTVDEACSLRPRVSFTVWAHGDMVHDTSSASYSEIVSHLHSNFSTNIVIHIIMMSLLVFFLIPLGIGLALKKSHSHKWLQLLNVILMIVAVSVAYADVEAEGHPHFTSTHAALGLTTLLCFLFIALIGGAFKLVTVLLQPSSSSSSSSLLDRLRNQLKAHTQLSASTPSNSSSIGHNSSDNSSVQLASVTSSAADLVEISLNDSAANDVNNNNSNEGASVVSGGVAFSLVARTPRLLSWVHRYLARFTVIILVPFTVVFGILQVTNVLAFVDEYKNVAAHVGFGAGLVVGGILVLAMATTALPKQKHEALRITDLLVSSPSALISSFSFRAHPAHQQSQLHRHRGQLSIHLSPAALTDGSPSSPVSPSHYRLDDQSLDSSPPASPASISPSPFPSVIDSSSTLSSLPIHSSTFTSPTSSVDSSSSSFQHRLLTAQSSMLEPPVWLSPLLLEYLIWLFWSLVIILSQHDWSQPLDPSSGDAMHVTMGIISLLCCLCGLPIVFLARYKIRRESDLVIHQLHTKHPSLSLPALFSSPSFQTIYFETNCQADLFLSRLPMLALYVCLAFAMLSHGGQGGFADSLHFLFGFYCFALGANKLLFERSTTVELSLSNNNRASPSSPLQLRTRRPPKSQPRNASVSSTQRYVNLQELEAQLPNPSLPTVTVDMEQQSSPSSLSTSPSLSSAASPAIVIRWNSMIGVEGTGGGFGSGSVLSKSASYVSAFLYMAAGTTFAGAHRPAIALAERYFMPNTFCLLLSVIALALLCYVSALFSFFLSMKSPLSFSHPSFAHSTSRIISTENNDKSSLPLPTQHNSHQHTKGSIHSLSLPSL